MITPVMPTYARTELAFDHGRGVRLFTTDGTGYLDFGAGIAVQNDTDYMVVVKQSADRAEGLDFGYYLRQAADTLLKIGHVRV